jgi:hypothetical protein
VSWSDLTKAVAIWIVLASIAMINGVLREAVFKPPLGEAAARPLSAMVVLAGAFALAWLHHVWSDGLTIAQAWMVGCLWLTMTLLFETLLGTMRGMSASEILSSYHPMAPTYWLYVVLGIFLAPAIVFFMRRRRAGWRPVHRCEGASRGRARLPLASLEAVVADQKAALDGDRQGDAADRRLGGAGALCVDVKMRLCAVARVANFSKNGSDCKDVSCLDRDAPFAQVR